MFELTLYKDRQSFEDNIKTTIKKYIPAEYIDRTLRFSADNTSVQFERITQVAAIINYILRNTTLWYEIIPK